MNLKKNDKLILIAGVIILIVSAIGIALYTSEDTSDFDFITDSDKIMYDFTWREITTEMPIIDGNVEKRNTYSVTQNIKSPDYSVLTNVEFQIKWVDDHTYGLLITKGADTLTAKIGKPGAEPERKSSTERGNMTFTFSVNDRPMDDYVEAEDAEEAKEMVEEWFPNENEASFDVIVNIETGEKIRRPIRWILDRGNDFDLKIEYTYYVLEILEPEDDDNDDDDVPPTGLNGYNGALGEFYKNLCYGRGMI